MCWLEISSEQLAIGAVLAGRTLPPSVMLLQAGDFAYPVASDLYTDVLRQQAVQHGPRAENVIAALAGRYEQRAGMDADTLAGYARQGETASDAQIALAYQWILLDGSERAIQDATNRLRRPVPEGADERQVRAGYYEQLGLALHRRNKILDTVAPEDDDARNGLVSGNPDQRDAERPDKPSRARIKAEEQVLAGLAQHPATQFTVAGWLSEWVFTGTPRRNIYRVLTEHRLPHTTATNQHQLQQALKGLHVFDCPHDMGRAEEQALTARVHRLEVTPVDTVATARALHEGGIQ